MPKIIHKVHTSKQSKKPTPYLDKSFYLRTGTNNQSIAEVEIVSKDKKTLQKRARAKVLTIAIVKQLLKIDTPFKSRYRNTLYCGSLIIQENEKFTSRYCNSRWCMICNRIRTAKLIDGYLPEIKKFKNPYFLTLTIPNVEAKEAHELKYWFDRMLLEFTRIKDFLRKGKKGYLITGIRKIECTYNPETKEFHPHFHFIIDNEEITKKNGEKSNTIKEIITEWLNRFPQSKGIAQHFKRCDILTTKELFKYFTELLKKNKNTGKFEFHAEAMDLIFRAMFRKRVFQAMGNVKKQIAEDVEELQAEIFDFIPAANENWNWDNQVNDWISSQGELLSGYELSNRITELINQIEYKPP